MNKSMEEMCDLETLATDYCLEDDVFHENPKQLLNIPQMCFFRKTREKQNKHSLTLNRDIVKCIACVFFCCVAVIITTLVFINLLDKKIQNPKQTHFKGSKVKGCDHVEVEDVWITALPKLLTESAFRLLDVNRDGILDVIVGFATGVDGYSIPRIVCDIYFNGTYPCFGGMMAIDGKNGIELWRYYTDHEIFGINCNTDLNSDGLNDCLGGGRAGVFDAVNGQNGTLLWKFKDRIAKNSIMNLYTAHIVDDLDEDGVLDILAVHGGDPLSKPGSKHRLSGRIVFFSGKSGKVLSWSGVPDKKETYYSPQILTKSDGTKLVLFGTGGETHGGALWVININDLFYHRLQKAISIFSDSKKGVMTPPVLLDLNSDGEDDIIMSLFNSHVIAFDGRTFTQLWNYSVPLSESYITPAPGFYNDDAIPDFLIKFAHGPGFPIYYYSETTILDGRDGMSLLKSPIVDTIGTQSSPLTISMDGYGNDVYLYWISDCEDHEGKGDAYRFVKGTNIHEQSRSDFCRLRFKSKGYSKLKAKNQHMNSNGIDVYYSGNRRHVEHQGWINTTKESVRYIETHPVVYHKFLKYQQMKEKEDKNNKELNKEIIKFTRKDHNKGKNIDDLVSTSLLGSFRERKVHTDLNSKVKEHDRRQSPNIGKMLYTNHQRYKRHIGPHDDEGIQRLLSTGTLAPTTLDSTHPKYNHSIDVIFATYWFFPAKTRAILPMDQLCISKKMDSVNLRFDISSKYYGMDENEFEHTITEECLNKSGHELPQDETYESQSTYNPYNIHMGQMTVYRLRLTFSCKKCQPMEYCSHVLPFEKQQWTAYMGNNGDNHWKPR